MSSHISQPYQPLPLLLTAPQVAAQLGISRGLAYRYIAEGRLPAIRLGSCVRVACSDLLQFVEENKAKPAAE